MGTQNDTRGWSLKVFLAQCLTGANPTQLDDWELIEYTVKNVDLEHRDFTGAGTNSQVNMFNTPYHYEAQFSSKVVELLPGHDYAVMVHATSLSQDDTYDLSQLTIDEGTNLTIIEIAGSSLNSIGNGGTGSTGPTGPTGPMGNTGPDGSPG